MRLDPFTRDYRGFVVEFVSALELAGTRFYFDTSVLMWLIQISARAREEFITWCQARPPESIRVPVWAAHELHRHVSKRTIRSNVKKTVDDACNRYDDFVQLAWERADEEACVSNGYSGRKSYVGELVQSAVRLSHLKRVVEPNENRLRVAADEVIAFVNEHVLQSDLEPLVKNLSLTGDFRFSHHMPPGFQDQKQENRYGDVIIWREIIEDLLLAGSDTGDQPRHAVLVSRDDKTDWVSSAHFVRNQWGKEERANRAQELDVTLPHPLLVHELACQTRGGRLYITHPGFLASALDWSARRSHQESGISHWLEVAHRREVLSNLSSLTFDDMVRTGGEAPPDGGGEILGVRASSGRSSGDEEPTQDSTSTASMQGKESWLEKAVPAEIMSPPIGLEIRRYEESLAGEQGVLFAAWAAEVRNGSLSSYKFGRILAELSIRGDYGWPEYLQGIVEELSHLEDQMLLNEVVLALITSIYFDPYGEPLRRPHAELATLLLPLETDTRLEPAFHALNRLLTKSDVMLPYVPGSGRSSVDFALQLTQEAGISHDLVRDIRIGGHSALVEASEASHPRRLSSLLRRTEADGCTGLEMRMLLAREYLIPPDRLSNSLDRKKLRWLPEFALVVLDTESACGLSALAD